MSLWVFGYGSLIWNPGFPYQRRERARLSDWNLRFWQASTDHRGTPDYPGRVATLVPESGGMVWGHAYLLDQDSEAALKYLDHREKGGYERVFFQVETESGRTLRALTYLGGEANPSFVGPEAEDATARIIAKAIGPSGANIDYLANLHLSLRDFPYLDPHVDRLLHLARSL